ncbi:MAG: GFA family protein [Pseudomonadota bacterium]
MALTGGCQCGAVRYQIDRAPLGFLRCHCLECQAQSASAFGLSLYVPDGSVTFTGRLSHWDRVTERGGTMRNHFCPTCGSRLMHEKRPEPAYLSIKAGSLDPGHGLVPVAEVWTSRRLPWIAPIDGALQVAEQPESMEEIMARWTKGGQSRDEETVAFYDNAAADYAPWSVTQADPERLARFLDTLAEGAEILDLGSGAGWATAEMVQRGFRAIGLDASAALAEEAQKTYGVEVRVGDFSALEDRQAFDAVWAFFSLQHIPADGVPDVLARIHRALRPGGRLLIGIQEGDAPTRDRMGRLYVPWQEAALTEHLQSAGFAIAEVERGSGSNYDGTPYTTLFLTATA